MLKDEVFDVAVVGGGVVGCAVARRLTLNGARCVLFEKGSDILSGASKGNSALLHTGFDAPPGSLELQCMRAGYAEYRDIHERMNLPLLKTGAIIVAWTEDEAAQLAGIAVRGRDNGIDDLVFLDAAGVLHREPHLAATLKAGLLVPGEHVIDPWSAPLAYISEAVRNGAVLRTRTAVTDGSFSRGHWTLWAGDERVHTRFVVNCAGLYGDRLDSQLLGDACFTIKPRKGQFVVFDKAAAEFLRTIVLPVPGERSKGVVVCPTVFGNVLVGPTAEEQDERGRASVSADGLSALREQAIRIVPALADIPVTAVYAGLRPATDSKEYRIREERERNWLTLGGIRSTGLTAALGLAQYAAGRLADMGLDSTPLRSPVGVFMPNLAEHRRRDWQNPGYERIVCHCEMVTDREIAAAFTSPVPPGDLGGLKRRTRACMGRCQGFYCGAEIAGISEGHFAFPLAVGERGAA